MSKNTFVCIDAHTCGNPVRVIKEGVPRLIGHTMEQKRQHFLKEYDWIRKGLMFEPRGHDMMSGSMLYPPHNPENDFAILFIETSGCLPMCGHGTIGTITIAIEEGLITPKTSGKIKYPNMFIHPENETIRDVSHMLWTGNPIDPTSSGRNAVFYGDKAIDRSPCGTGTSARLAQLFAKGKLKKGEDFIHESFIGSKFIGRVEEETTLDGRLAIIPSIKGWAKIYGHNVITIDDEDDPYAHGFQVI